jgi:hypothetical protein
MEYCGGDDLSTVVNQAMKKSRPIPEDTVWQYSFKFSKRCAVAIAPTTISDQRRGLRLMAPN